MARVSDIMDQVRQEMDDVNGNTFSNTVQLGRFNRLYTDLNRFLIEIGAEVARKGPLALDLTTVTTDATDPSAVPMARYESGDSTTTYYRWALPADFLAFVQEEGNRIYTRFRWVEQGKVDRYGIKQYDRKHVDEYNSPIAVGESVSLTKAIPQFLYLHRDGSTQYVSFNFVPDETKISQMLYWYFPKVAAFTDPPNEDMPWLDILNEVFVEAMVFWARNWKEFTEEVARAWALQAQNRAQEILGLRVTDDITVGPSIWRGFYGDIP